jgi:hypothetical protein
MFCPLYVAQLFELTVQAVNLSFCLPDGLGRIVALIATGFARQQIFFCFDNSFLNLSNNPTFPRP